MSTIIVPVPVTIDLKIKQAQIVPFSKMELLRRNIKGYADLPRRIYGRSGKQSVERIEQWSNYTSHQVWEIHFPVYKWQLMFSAKERQRLLTDPNNQAALNFIGGKNLNYVAGHPNGTEFFLINDDVYRRLTWRSVTLSYWDRRERDRPITAKDKETGNVIYFLVKCNKLNEEPLKSTIVDHIGAELLERDRPKDEDEGPKIIPF